jgi:2,4-dienoyl-CoA reductase-like NADH-dependent reductase (Old Yellow Enzyme family)
LETAHQLGKRVTVRSNAAPLDHAVDQFAVGKCDVVAIARALLADHAGRRTLAANKRSDDSAPLGWLLSSAVILTFMSFMTSR